MQLALIVDGRVQSEADTATAALRGPDDKPLFDIRDVSKVKDIDLGWIAKEDGTFAAPELSEAGPAVPPSVSSAQAKIQLRRAGLRNKVDAAVQAAGGEMQDWFTDARTWERTSQYVLDLGASLKLKPADLDKLFKAAAQIAV